jgi:hypothetical protein
VTVAPEIVTPEIVTPEIVAPRSSRRHLSLP